MAARTSAHSPSTITRIAAADTMELTSLVGTPTRRAATVAVRCASIGLDTDRSAYAFARCFGWIPPDRPCILSQLRAADAVEVRSLTAMSYGRNLLAFGIRENSDVVFDSPARPLIAALRASG